MIYAKEAPQLQDIAKLDRGVRGHSCGPRSFSEGNGTKVLKRKVK